MEKDAARGKIHRRVFVLSIARFSKRPLAANVPELIRKKPNDFIDRCLIAIRKMRPKPDRDQDALSRQNKASRPQPRT